MKKGPKTKTERNRALYNLWKLVKEEKSLEEIGRMFPNDGKPLSPQRVFQIIQGEQQKAQAKQ